MGNQKRLATQSEIFISLGLGAIVLFFLLTGSISYFNTRTLTRDAMLVSHTHQVIADLEELQSLMKDAETGQRGYLITGDEKYLAPHTAAVAHMDERLSALEQLINNEPKQQERMISVRKHITAKLSELAQTIELRRAQGFDAARMVVISDRGKNEMDALRELIGSMENDEQQLRSARLAEMDNAYKTAVVSGILACALGILLSLIVARFARRAERNRTRQEWLQSGQVKLSAAMFGDQRVDELGENILNFLSEYIGANAAALFVQHGNDYVRVATYGVPADSKIIGRFGRGDGILGQVAKDGKSVLIDQVPEGYLSIGSALLRGSPRHLLVVPAASDGVVNVVIEFGFLNPLSNDGKALLELIAGAIGVAVRSAHYRENLQNLLEETQRQTEELQSQGEELRVNNEELEEQSRALKESQTRLEQQQVELEQTNSQLEEQTQQLEAQRDDLARSQAAVQQKARELEQASQYKSDFLANMSHELRTPLNSSLILAKLLADNSAGNLSEEQVRFAQTIQSSGNDLLALINDILDLSKIEAGHMEVRPEAVKLERLMQDLERTFAPVTEQRGLMFKVSVAPDSPKTIDTDRQRLEQILKNLLSNAIKFTEKGSVELEIRKTDEGLLNFAVKDTGIGIPSEQQQAIFEAFRQADGTISRKYGGTGLGLSISRELARLLGGQITLSSTLNEGSVFTLTLPEFYDANHTPPAPLPAVVYPAANEPVTTAPESKKTVKRVVHIDDDREHLHGNSRIILVIEDDISFAKILYDLTRELEFQCIIATSAEEGLAMALQYAPSAVLLDVGLPDNSGLSVLDRLKRDVRTRHIPVHVVSANDHAQTAFSLGAVGHMLKPVKRDELVKALKGLEIRLAQRLRRVLIVEDDEVQRDSICKLLGSHDVQTVAVGTAADCLRLLKESTFDCMVLDLSLPDASGYSLLETLSREEAYSFPPVIVYTGRDFSGDEEQRLRRYSKSIIIKGAKSPERLLDEVTLFLHQVVADLPSEQQHMLEQARNRDAVLEGRHILVVEDDVRNVYALTSIFEPLGVMVHIARNGLEALDALGKLDRTAHAIDLVLMDVMMPEMDGLTATREIRKQAQWKKLPVIMLTAKAMKDDQERCLDAGANDYMAKPLDVEKLLSLVRVWMPR